MSPVQVSSDSKEDDGQSVEKKPLESKSDQEELKVKVGDDVKEETLSSKEQVKAVLTVKDPEMLSGGIKVFRTALNTFAANPDEDVTSFHVTEKCKTMSCYLGIDEAGRGPVLGPMVYSIFACVADSESIEKKKKSQSLSKIEDSPPILLDKDKFNKLNDSKQLSDKVREEIFTKFSDLDYIAFGLKIISPTQIANKSFRRQKYSLNEISHNAAIELIQGLSDKGVKIEKVFVDTVGPMDKYQKKLEQTFPDLRFKVDKKADSKYKPVSAASVCAKVTRDIAVKEWKFSPSDKVDLGPTGGPGSGYPADPVTKGFMRRNIDPVFGYPNLVRTSWSTASDLLDKCAVKVKWESDEPDEASAPKISRYFGKKKSTSKMEDGQDQNEGEVPEMLRRKSQFFSYRDLFQTASIF